MDPGQQLHRETIKLLSNPTKFRSLIGKLLYLTRFRPEYNFSVCILSQLLSKPTNNTYTSNNHNYEIHQNALSLGLSFKQDSSLTLTASHPDWKAYPKTIRSTIELCFYLGTSPISWKNKKHQTISRSLSYLECRTLTNVSSEVQWLVYMFQDFSTPPLTSHYILWEEKCYLHKHKLRF